MYMTYRSRFREPETRHVLVAELEAELASCFGTQVCGLVWTVALPISDHSSLSLEVVKKKKKG